MPTHAIVTGASAGLGRELARLLSSKGHGLVLVARRERELAELAAELSAKYQASSVVVPCDLADPSAPQRIHDEVERAGAEVEVLVNNAGFGSNGNFWELDPDRELGMVQVNVAAIVHLTRLFLPGMIARRRGRILNIGSTAGFQPGPFMATYYASKAFVNSFSEALAFETRGTGVTVTLSCPGATATEFAGVAGNDKSALFNTGGVADASAVAREAFDAMMEGRPRVVHGFRNKAGLQALRLSPRAAAVAIAAKLNRRAEG